jgi:hypothetical protein
MRYKCDNCEGKGEIEELELAKHLNERLDNPVGHPLCIMPAGECPGCGALVYGRPTTFQFFNKNQEAIWYVTSEICDMLENKSDDMNGKEAHEYSDEDRIDIRKQIEDIELVAPLIEAAPILYAALQRMVAEYKNGNLTADSVKEADEALAKAEIGN